MQRVKIFYWRTDLQIPQTKQEYTFTELAWIHDQDVIGREGDGWSVISNSVVTVLPDSNEILMATTMTQEVEDAVPDTI